MQNLMIWHINKEREFSACCGLIIHTTRFKSLQLSGKKDFTVTEILNISTAFLTFACNSSHISVTPRSPAGTVQSLMSCG